MKNGKNESIFDKLSKDLDEEERKALLDKLKKDQNNQNISDQDSIDQKKETNIQKQLHIAESTYKTLGLFSKLIIWLISFFSNKKKEEVVLEKLFDDLKKKIHSINPAIIDFKHNILTNEFVSQILSLGEICNTSIKIIEKYFGDTSTYNGFISSIVEENLTDELKKISNELKPENFKITTEYVEEKEYMQEKENKIKVFFEKLTLLTLNEINFGFLNLELVIRLITFDFKSLLFELTKNSTGLNGYNSGIKFPSVSDLLEKLYTLLFSIEFEYEDISFIEKINVFLENNKDLNIEKKELLSENDIILLKKIFDILNNLKIKIPFKEIFQYFKKDLLYKPAALKLKFDSIQIYKEYKKNEINYQWEEYLKKIKEVNLNKLINNLFKDYKYDTLKFFNLDLKNEVDKHSLVKLMYVKKINILTNFIERIYKKEIERILNRILIEGNFNKESDRNSFSTDYYKLYNALDALRKYDNNFDSSNEFGKKITTFIKISASEVEYTYSLKNVTIDINNSSKEILTEIFNNILSVYNFVSNLARHYELNTPILINYDKIKIPGYISLLNIMQKLKNYFDQFFKIYDLMDDL